MQTKRFSSCLWALFMSGVTAAAFAQQAVLSGIVRDINTYREIRGVNIYIKNTNLGTSSDYTGKYTLIVPGANPAMIVVFRHIGYEPRELSIDSVRAMQYVELQPRIIPLPGVVVEEKSIQRLEIAKDLPQTVSVIDAKSFEIRGYVDAGDLLKTDHSVQVEEELSGKKTAAIRGGNPDEVVVLYNGIKMNSNYDNIFDLSLIDLEDIERFEIIKGSNTALYGPEAFSGVINVVPKIQQDYNIRFQQRVGTYRSGNWGLHLYEKLNRLHGSYSFKQGKTKRNFVDQPQGADGLVNSSLHHTASLNYAFSEHADGSPANALGGMYMYTSLDYENHRDVERLSNLNHLLSFKYTGDLGWLKRFDLSTSARQLKEEQFLAAGTGAFHRRIDDRALHFNAEKSFTFGLLDLLFGYQFQHAELDFTDERRNFQEQPIGLESAGLQRQHHGLVSIAKLHGDTHSDFFQIFDVNASLRHDRVHDAQSDPLTRNGTTRTNDAGLFEENKWQDTMFKLALNLSGYREDLAFNTFLNLGSNSKFPTLFQQISAPDLICYDRSQPNLQPEENTSMELGMVVSREIRGNTAVYGWQFSGNFFKNQYQNKFRIFSTPGLPIAFYDNTPNARISGFETKASLFLFRKKVTADLGLSKYSISEKAAFPFKADFKATFNLLFDHAGYSFQLHLFKEGEQAGWVRFSETSNDSTGLAFCQYAEVRLPSFSNLDLHFSKSFSLGKFKFLANASGRNLLNAQEVVLQGLALRDRRYYLTFGAQY